MAQDSVKLNIPLLNGVNYVFWKTKVRAGLVRDDLWSVGSEPKPEDPTADWKKKNSKALAYITLSVEDNQLIHFAHFDKAHKAWQTLSAKYERSTFGSRLYLRRKLYSIHYHSGPMSSHIDAIMEVVGLLRGSGKSLEDEEIVAVLLVSLSESYSGLVTALEGRNEADLTIEYVTGKMMDEYQRRCESGETVKEVHDTALQAATSSAGKIDRQKGPCKGGKDKAIWKNENKETRKCFFCDKKGHLKVNCTLWKKAQKANIVASKTSDAKVSIASNYATFVAQVKNHGIRSRGWYVDSGATNHMTNEREFFTVLNDTKTIVALADGSCVEAAGIGEGWLRSKSRNGKI